MIFRKLLAASALLLLVGCSDPERFHYFTPNAAQYAQELCALRGGVRKAWTSRSTTQDGSRLLHVQVQCVDGTTIQGGKLQ